MKLSTALQKYKQRLTNRLPSNDLFVKALISLSALAVLGGIIWLYGPLLAYQGIAPLAQPEKRLYAIAFFFLAWALKFLIVDLGFPNTLQYKNPKIRGQLTHLVNRFRGAMRFMKKTTINSHGKKVQLLELPWYLLLGPANAGKTALLAHSRIPFILQRQFSPEIPEHFEPSENCDWWITRDASIIDVPSKYLFHANPQKGNGKKEAVYALLWKFFLNLIKKQSDKKTINGIVIALPLPEIIKQNNSKEYHAMINTLNQRIKDIQAVFSKPLPCYIIITKCDLISGFPQFFAETSDDELSQAWGVMLPKPKSTERVEHLFVNRFNTLIKKLNQQLLWRMHQERNPMVRPYIKDFPLQIEKVKEATLEFIKRAGLSKNNCILKGVYLTSALQVKPEPETTVVDENLNTEEHAVQLFQDPTAKSRAYFIKQFITHALHSRQETVARIPASSKWKRATAYAASAAIIVSTGYLLGRDFQVGIKQTYEIKSNLAGYRQVIKSFHNPDENMVKTLALLDALQRSVKPVDTKLSLKALLSFYSNKSQKNASAVYHHALQAFLMPEVRNYFAEYLKDPVNRDANSIYRVFAAYLMLGNPTHLDKAYVRAVMLAILPQSFPEKNKLLHHFDIAMHGNNFKPLPLNNDVVKNTRKFLTAMPGIQLSYIILKSMDGNTQDSQVSLDTGSQVDVIFTNAKPNHHVPEMFTGKSFNNIINREIRVAAEQAIRGNWILGKDTTANNSTAYTVELSEKLRAAYISKYVNLWESLISDIKIMKPKDLAQADAMIVSLISYDSPLLQVLHILYENTYFEPVTKTSHKLLTLGELINKNNSSKNQLYQILSDLQELHEYLQPVISAEDPKKAAYKLLSDRMKHQGEPDPITKLRLAADKAPMPLKAWLNQLTNDTWHFLLKSSMRYLDTSWTQKVIKPYQYEIADRYPFTKDAPDEVTIKKFIRFFGKPGVVTSFYNKYLTPFIDKSKREWHWKKVDNKQLPFSQTVLRQIQQAMKIHKAFFPNDDDQLYVPFALQKQKLGKDIKSIKLSINDKVIEDNSENDAAPHVLKWPHKLNAKSTSIQLTMADDKTVKNTYKGSWGWFKLVNQSYESSKSSKEIIVNFSKDKNAAKYVLSTKSKVNPFIALNLNHFKLADKLTTSA